MVGSTGFHMVPPGSTGFSSTGFYGVRKVLGSDARTVRNGTCEPNPAERNLAERNLAEPSGT